MNVNTIDENETGKTGNNSLKPTAADLLADRQGSLPVWVRPPKRGPEYFSGFTRPKLYQLAAEGKIKTASIRENGALKGVRLFHLASVLAYIERHTMAA